jgi:hypothetical protein
MGIRQTYVGDTEPSNPQDVLWLSTALRHARFPQHPGDAYVAIDLGAAISVQEPNVWVHDGFAYMTINAGGSVLFRTRNPRTGPWERITSVLGGGVGGEAGSVTHPGVFRDGDTLYMYYTKTPKTQCFLATANVNTPTVWTYQSAVLTETATFLPGLASFGNFAAYRAANGKVRLMFEGTFGSGGDSWISGVAESDSPTGPFTILAGALPSLEASMYLGGSQAFPTPVPTGSLLEGYRQTYGCGPVFFELGGYTTVYHGGQISSGDGGARSELHRATSPDGINWTVDLGGYPVHQRVDHRWEIDQCADPCPFKFGDVWYCAWTAASNVNSRFVIKVAPLAPSLLIHDGMAWVPVDQQGGNGSTFRMRERSRYTSGIVFPFDDLPVDPGATANLAVPLPHASQGAEVRVSNITASTGTVLPAAQSGQSILGANAAITAGQMVVYKCLKMGVWVRMG